MRILASAVIPATAQIMLLIQALYQYGLEMKAFRNSFKDMIVLIQNVELFCRSVLLQELAGHLSLRGENNAIFR
jgi:hypothetical protein